MKTAKETREITIQKYNEWYEERKISFVVLIEETIKKRSESGYGNGSFSMLYHQHFVIRRTFRKDLFTDDAMVLLKPFIEAGYSFEMQTLVVNNVVVSW